MNLHCQSCGATMTMSPELRTAKCPYCESPQVIERPPDPSKPDPTFALGFLVGKESAHGTLRGWLKGRTIFAHAGVHKATLDEVKGMYTPAYLYSATARSDYTAEIGENYTETTTTRVNGKTVTRTVTKTEWRSLAGSFASYVSDVVVTASKSVGNAELQGVEPFDLRQMTRFTPALVSGWVAEEASLGQNECLGLARDEGRGEVSRRLATFMPGDSHRNLQHHTGLDAESLDLMLVPLWIFALKYDPKKPPFRVLINGQTGKIHGKVPLSWVKITLTVLGVLIPIGAAIAYAATH